MKHMNHLDIIGEDPFLYFLCCACSCACVSVCESMSVHEYGVHMCAVCIYVHVGALRTRRGCHMP